MSNIFVTSDLHLSHNKPFIYEARGFNSVQEMNEKIVENWNSVINENDSIFNLGDIALTNLDEAIPYLRALHGQQIWILGNHDSKDKVDRILKVCPNIHLLGTGTHMYDSYATVYKYSKRLQFYLSHYPTNTGNLDDKGIKTYCLCGHTHTKDRWSDIKMNCYHVDMDAHNCFPVLLDDIVSEINNFRTSTLNS